MAKLLLGSIDLTKIDKTKIVKTDKNGAPFKNGAQYINVAIWVNDTPDQYGNIAAIQMGDKDNKIYIGNLKEYQPNQSQPKSQPTQQQVDSDDLPF